MSVPQVLEARYRHRAGAMVTGTIIAGGFLNRQNGRDVKYGAM
jgi:hypothetical protein